MEDVLSQIITAASSNNAFAIKKVALSAQELLSIQQGLIRDPAYELREKCLKVVQLCLETKRSKFVGLAINLCHRLLRDDRFHSNFELADDSKWLLGQLIQATSSFSTQTDDTQVDILKVYLNVACGNVWNMNGRLIIGVLSLCSEAFESGNAAVRTAAQAAASQSLRSFISQLEEEDDLSDAQAEAFNDVIPIFQYLCSRIDSSESTSRCEHGVLFLLECLLTVLSSLTNRIQANPHLKQILWQKLAPALISVLGTPRVDKHITTRASGDNVKERGRGSGCLGAAPTLPTIHARTVYSISIELVRLVGSVAALRPMLESLFHRMLLYPSAEHRLDALRATCELLRNPLRLLDIAGPLEEGKTQPSDMALLRLIMDSIEECRRGDLPLLSAAVSCCSAFLEALQELCRGTCLPPSSVETVLGIWPALQQCDYSGPAFYQSVARLPSAYQHRIKVEKEMSIRDDGNESDSSGIGQKSDSSGDTEGPESLEQEVDSLVSEMEGGDRVGRGLGLGIIELPIGLGDSERQHARHFVGALHDLLSTLQPMWGNAQLDQALQTFASQYCQGVVREQPITEWGIIINADGIYLTTLSALLLDLRLYKAGYYEKSDKVPVLTEDEFVEEVQSSGVLVYLSGTWLREVYQAVVSGSLLKVHGYFSSETNNHSLINLLLDIGGLGTRQQGSEMLWESRRLEVAANTANDTPEVLAGQRLARLLLTCSWSSLLWVLAAPLSMKPVRGKRRQQVLRDTVARSLQGLQVAAKLCGQLGVQDRCNLILEQLSSASCNITGSRRLLTQRDAPPRLSVAAALSLELILQQGLELGSHCPACWPHVFRTVRAVRRLERAAFNSAANLDVAVTPPGFMGQEVLPQDDDEVDVYSFLRSSNGELMVTKYIKNIAAVDTLSTAQSANILTLLSYMSVELIMDAAYKLNLKSLEHFSRALCAASRAQLFFPPTTRSRSVPIPPNWVPKWLTPQEMSASEPYLIDSVGELMVKCARSSRPLAHVMRLWGVIGPHLTEAACHSDPAVSKKAVELIEAVINTHIKQGAELPYFHFNEALFKPFENLLCLELCESEIQDQVVSCICEFVEGSAGDVRSGWRALFGALRSASTSATFLDVFQLFLDTKNPLVFCSAAVDCILCLLKHVRSESETRRTACLRFLQRCEDVLAAVWVMPQPLVFQAAHRIHISDGLLVDSEDGTAAVVPFEIIPEDLQDLPSFSYPELGVSQSDTKLTLEGLDRPSGVLRVWFLLLEGLYSAAVSAPAEAQPALLDAVFADSLNLIQRSDPEFGIFCMNHLLMPTTQTWLRQCLQEGESDLTGPKQALGLLCELVSACLRQHNRVATLQCELNLMLKQLFLLLIECTSIASAAYTPPSCFRHMFLNVGETLTAVQWRVSVLSLRRCYELTLVPLRQLLMAFAPSSHSFYGDFDQIKIAARRDNTTRDVVHTKHLAQQVFLLDAQREELPNVHEDKINGEEVMERSYTFLLRSQIDPADASDNVRIPVKTLVSMLLAHQALLQVTAALLLKGSSHHIPSLVHVLMSPETEKPEESHLPGHLQSMPAEDILILIDCLDLSYRAALQFDSRPGLKFLVQKVVGLERAANLYGQAGAAWAIKVVALFELCLYHIKEQKYSAEDIKNLQNIENSDAKVFITRLQENFEELCDTYIDVVVDNDGTHSALDKAPDHPILFLSACQDEQIVQIQPRQSVSDVLLDEPEEGNTLKPFRLADFIDTVSASSTSDSELEFAEDYEEDLKHNSDFDEEYVSDRKCNDVDDGKETKAENNVVDEEEEVGERVAVDVGNQSDDAEGNGRKDLIATMETEEEFVEKTQQEDMEITAEESKCKEVKILAGQTQPEDVEVTAEETDCEDVNITAEESERVVESMSAALEEYKKRKQKYGGDKRRNPFIPPAAVVVVEPSVPPEIEQQRRSSFLKDSEAHRRVWAEMLSAVFKLLSQLSDDEFRTVLPIFFGGIRRLTAHATDTTLKQDVAEVFARVALVYGFASP